MFTTIYIFIEYTLFTKKEYFSICKLIDMLFFKYKILFFNTDIEVSVSNLT